MLQLDFAFQKYHPGNYVESRVEEDTAIRREVILENTAREKVVPCAESWKGAISSGREEGRCGGGGWRGSEPGQGFAVEQRRHPTGSRSPTADG